MIAMRYILHWLRYKLMNLVRPYVLVTPASSTCQNSIRLHGYGFTIFLAGVPQKRCGKRVNVSWLGFMQGPCSFREYAAVRGVQVSGGVGG